MTSNAPRGTAPRAATAPKAGAPQASKPGKPSPEVIARRRKTVAFIALGIIGAVALLTAFVAPGFAFRDAPEDESAAVVFAAQPRIGERTELVEAVPDDVGALRQQRIDAYLPWVADGGAVEAWTFTFADGTLPPTEQLRGLLGSGNGDDATARDGQEGDQPTSSPSPEPESDATNEPGQTDSDIPTPAQPPLATTVVVATIGQWRNNSAAEAFFTAQAEALATARTGNVAIGERTVGEYVLAGSRGEGVMLWRNGTVVVHATGTRAALEAFFAQFPL